MSVGRKKMKLFHSGKKMKLSSYGHKTVEKHVFSAIFVISTPKNPEKNFVRLFRGPSGKSYPINRQKFGFGEQK